MLTLWGRSLLAPLDTGIAGGRNINFPPEGGFKGGGGGLEGSLYWPALYPPEPPIVGRCGGSIGVFFEESTAEIASCSFCILAACFMALSLAFAAISSTRHLGCKCWRFTGVEVAEDVAGGGGTPVAGVVVKEVDGVTWLEFGVVLESSLKG